ncbi:MAG: addiction module antidote protein, HigA family [Ruminococcaceae bacterium]|nr:addiction module antidote protein, HigA family [Oscillospiraceae bacterium]
MNRKPTHPGTVFYEDVMKPLHLSVTRTAELLGVSRKTLSEFINEKSSLSPDMALRISKLTGTSAKSWMNMQQKSSQWTAELEKPSNDI